MDIMTIISNAAGELIAPTTAAYVLAAIGLNIHFGMTGLMNMGQAGFMLLGAYGFAITQSMGCNLFASVCAALALAVIYALLLGIPTLKLGPDYLAMVTLAAAEIIRIIGRSTAMTNFTGGSAGISPQDFTEKFESLSPLPDGSTTFLLWTYSNNIANSWWLRIVAWVLVVIAALLCWRWFHSPWGRMLKGIREDENAIRKFGGMTAVDVSHFEIERHGITALIGPNGAGKTTFFNLMTGFDTPNTGTWQFDGKDMAHVQPEKVARMGMVRTFQLTKVMSRLTVLDNMLLGAPVQPGEGMFRALFPGMWRKQEQANIEKAEALLERFLLIKKKDDYAGALSGGQRKLLEMARALMSDPKLVMLDEPMAGVNPALKQSLLDHIMALREEGTTVLFVEHDINMVRHIADWVTVMAEGKIVAEGQPKSVMNDPAVIDAYLGAHANVDLGDDSVLEDLKEA